MKENLLSQKDVLEPYRTKFTSICLWNVHNNKLADIVNKYRSTYRTIKMKM